MFAIIVTEKGGDQRRLEFDKSEVTIGRVQGNDVILPKGNVSKRHARIVLKDGKFIIVDLKSTNGTYVNGRKITSPLVVKDNDKIYIGDYILGVDGAARGSAAKDMGGFGPPSAPESMAPPPQPSPPPMPARSPGPPRSTPSVPMPPPMDPMAEIPSAPSGMPMMGPPPAVPAPPPAPPRSMAPPPMSSSPIGVPISIPAMSSSAPVMAPAPMMSSSSPSSAPMPMPAPVAMPSAAPAPSSGPVPQASRRPPPLRDSSQPRLVGVGAPRAARMRPAGSFPSRGVQVPPLEPQIVRMLQLQESILERLVSRLDLDNIPIERLGDDALWQKAESVIVDLVETLDSSGELPKSVDQDKLIRETLLEALGVGPLEDLLTDESIDEILADRRDRILVSRNGTLAGSGKAFSSDDMFRRVLERLVAPTGQSINDVSPVVDVRLRDGWRLTAVVPPVAVRGACLVLRKPRLSPQALGDLVGSGNLSPQMADFLTTCVLARKNLLVCGAPSAGKSLMLTALASVIPMGERIVSVEEVAELAIARDEWIALEARSGDSGRLGELDAANVLRSALRLNPDRLVVGDLRSGEAVELISAMSSSMDGVLVSMAGEGAAASLGRMAAMARLGAPGSTADALRDWVAGAIDVVVHVARYADGMTRVVSIAEVMGVQGGGFDTSELFCFRGMGADGGFAAAGIIPLFYGELESRGIPADTSIFRT